MKRPGHRLISRASYWKDFLTKPAPLHFVECEPDWEQASRTIAGYSDESILDSVARSARAVRDGVVAYERDGVVFDRIQYSWPVLSGVLWAARRNNSSLKVLDFGGALGSHYYQYKAFHKDLKDVSWAVVEQSGMVEIGNREFATSNLMFFDTISEATDVVKPHVAMASGSLCYVPDPAGVLQGFSDSTAGVLILDRVPVHKGSQNLLARQQIGRRKTDKGYLAWILAEQWLYDQVSAQWDIVETFPSLDRDWRTNRGRWFQWVGLIAQRKK